jgi:hypothetical protein
MSGKGKTKESEGGVQPAPRSEYPLEDAVEEALEHSYARRMLEIEPSPGQVNEAQEGCQEARAEEARKEKTVSLNQRLCAGGAISGWGLPGFVTSGWLRPCGVVVAMGRTPPERRSGGFVAARHGGVRWMRFPRARASPASAIIEAPANMTAKRPPTLFCEPIERPTITGINPPAASADQPSVASFSFVASLLLAPMPCLRF